MTYFILDTNIWLDSIKITSADRHPIDLIDGWIETNEVTILLPEVIKREWNDNKSNAIIEVYSETLQLNEKSRKLHGREISNNLRSPQENQETARSFAEKIELIFDTKVVWLPITDEHRIQATKIGEEKKKPYGNKNGACDALIFLSMVDYIKVNHLENCVFVTGNWTDFSKSKTEKNVIHDDLKPDFESHGITYIHSLDTFIGKYSVVLSGTEESSSNGIETAKNILTYNTINPKAIPSFSNFKDSFIENTEFLKIIFKSNHLTKQQITFVFELFSSSRHYQQYMIRNIEKGVWFKILNDSNILNPTRANTNLSNDIIQNTYWTPLLYLEKISEQFKKDENLEFIDEVIEILKDITELGVKHYGTLYSIVKITGNIPNSRIANDVLSLIPLWLDSIAETRLESSELCEILLPKFLNDSSGIEDIEKAEIILKHLFAIEKSKVEHPLLYGGKGYIYLAKVPLYSLKQVLIENKLIQKIAFHCSNDIILFLADTLKKLSLYFPAGIYNTSLTDGVKDYTLSANILGNDLVMSLSESNNENEPETSRLCNFENHTKEQAEVEILNILQQFRVNESEDVGNKSIVKKIVNGLMNGSDHLYNYAHIRDLNIADSSEKVEETFALIFRELLSEKIKLKPLDGIELLQKFMGNNFYRIPFFRKIAFYVIGENWETTKFIFWGNIGEIDSYDYFSDYLFQNELYEILNKNQSVLADEEIELLRRIIDSDPQNKKYDDYDEDIELWRLRWYSALNLIEPFKSKYDELSLKLKFKETHFDISTSIRDSSNLASPFSKEELFLMKNKEVVENIISFRSNSHWDTPNIEGFAAILEEAVSISPKKFADEIELFIDVYYLYAYHILNGFRKSVANRIPFNHLNVMKFCKAYVSSDSFNSGKLTLQSDHWHTSQDWVIDSITNFLSELMQRDNQAIDTELLSMTKEIISILISTIRTTEQVIGGKANFSNTANSTTGKILTVLISYSATYAYKYKSEEHGLEWEEEAKTMYIDILNRAYIEAYVLIGFYFADFYQFDREWIIGKIEEFVQLDDNKWNSFFLGGYIYGNRPSNKYVYSLFYPHYQRAVENSSSLELSQAHGLNRHLLTFYLWGLENLEEGGLFQSYLKNISPSLALDLIQWICANERDLNTISMEIRNKTFEKVLNLWTYLSDKYDNRNESEDLKVKMDLYRLIAFTPKLDEQYTKLLLRSSSISDSHFFTRFLFKDLVRLKTEGEPFETAKYLAQILDSILLNPTTVFHYISPTNQSYIIDLVSFLFENGQQERACNLCEELAKHGHDFIRETYYKYMS